MNKYVIQCNSYKNAAEYASINQLHLSEWEWLPFKTIHENINVYELKT